MPRARPQRDEVAAAIRGITGVEIGDAALLSAALTHASARRGGDPDYQRLEFLGDRVLGLVVAEMLYEDHPEASEGELSLRLNALVNAETLAEIADETGVSGLIRASGGVRSGRKQVNLRADVMEALIAVVHLEHGLDAARAFIRRHWEGRAEAPAAARRDAKTALQEWAHQAHQASPVYAIDAREGPDHEPLFTVSVTVGAVEPARGTGRSKREAEQAAAAAMLEREVAHGADD